MCGAHREILARMAPLDYIGVPPPAKSWLQACFLYIVLSVSDEEDPSHAAVIEEEDCSNSPVSTSKKNYFDVSPVTSRRHSKKRKPSMFPAAERSGGYQPYYQPLLQKPEYSRCCKVIMANVHQWVRKERRAFVKMVKNRPQLRATIDQGFCKIVI